MTVARSKVSDALRGAAALHDLLNMIGQEGATDGTLAKLFVENEAFIGAFLTYGITELAGET